MDIDGDKENPKGIGRQGISPAANSFSQMIPDHLTGNELAWRYNLVYSHTALHFFHLIIGLLLLSLVFWGSNYTINNY